MMNMRSMNRRQMVALSAGLVAGSALFGSFAFGEEKAASTEAQATETVRPGSVNADGYVVDLNGDPCVEAGTVKTILTVNSVATEMVLMLGGEAVAATTGKGFEYGEGSLNRSMYPNLADIKNFGRDDATVENVAAIGPDLVIIDVPETIEALRAAGINAAGMSVTSPETIMNALDLIANALGGEAVQKAADYREMYEGARSEALAVAETIQDKPRVMYLRGVENTVGAGTMPNDWIVCGGGINVVDTEMGMTGLRCEITAEAIMESDPDVIVVENVNTYEGIMDNSAFSELAAVKNGQLYVAPLGPVVWSMGSSEALLQVYWAGSILNPDAFGYDLPAIMREYFAKFYSYELSDEEIEQILNRI